MRFFERLSVIFIGGILLLSAGCGDGRSSGGIVASLAKVEGKTEHRANPGGVFALSKAGDQMQKGGAVRTGSDGHAWVKFADASVAQVKPDGFLEITGNDLLARQNSGTVLYHFEKQDTKPAQVETPQGITAVLGTFFLLEVGTGQTRLVVEEGRVSFTPHGGRQVIVSAGEMVVAQEGKPLTAPIAIDPNLRDRYFREGKEALINQR